VWQDVSSDRDMTSSLYYMVCNYDLCTSINYFTNKYHFLCNLSNKTMPPDRQMVAGFVDLLAKLGNLHGWDAEAKNTRLMARGLSSVEMLRAVMAVDRHVLMAEIARPDFNRRRTESEIEPEAPL
jgi:hypothetical protein